jgi:RimJ/RimL family protein N-acetyltransferase
MILGKRVRLCPIESENLPLLAGWLNDPEIRRYLSHYLPVSKSAVEKWLKAQQELEPAAQPFLLEIKDGDNWLPIGVINFVHLNWRDRWAEIGIYIGDKLHWDNGYGSEAMRLMMQNGFNNLNLHAIRLKVIDQNTRAIRCYKKLGFIEEGRMREAQFQDGGYLDVILMSILRSEWKTQGLEELA